MPAPALRTVQMREPPAHIGQFGQGTATHVAVAAATPYRFPCVTQLIRQRRSVTGGVAVLHWSAAGICRQGRAAIGGSALPPGYACLRKRPAPRTP